MHLVKQSVVVVFLCAFYLLLPWQRFANNRPATDTGQWSSKKVKPDTRITQARRVTPTLNPNGTINTDSGKFTTNFYTLTFHAGKRRDIDNLIITRYDALGIELHAYLVGLGYTYPLKNKYGFVRLNGDWLYNIARANSDPVDSEKRVYGNWQRFDFQFTYIADKIYDYSTIDVKKRLNVSLKYYYQFPFMQNVSFLAGPGYRGQDEYNIFFQNSYAYATLGIAAGLTFNMHPRE